MATANSIIRNLLVQCSFNANQTHRTPSKNSKLPAKAVAQPEALAERIPSLTISEPRASRRPSLERCRELLEQDGAALHVASLLRQNPSLSRQLWADETLATAFITNLVAQSNVEAVESVLYRVRSRRPALALAAACFAEKGSVRGVALVEKVATKNRMLQDPASAELWFALIRAYGKLERLPAVRRAFKDARSAGAWSIEDTKHTNIYLNALHTDIKTCFIRARQLLDTGAVPDQITFNILLKACMRAKDAKRANLALKWMREYALTLDSVTWSSLIKIRSYTGDFDGVLATREAMITAGFEPTPSVWGSLLVACGAAQHHETALMLWREAKTALGGSQNMPANLYNAMLTACNACGQGERALQILEQMKAAGVAPTRTSYNLAIKACEGRAGQRLRLEQLAVALKLYEEMRTDGIHPDIVTYGTLIELCAEGKQGALARRLRDRMDEDDVKPNVVVMTSLLKALARGGLVEDCLETFGRMVWGPARVRPNRVTFKTLVRELREAGALGAALRAYEGMRKAQHAPSNVEFQELIAQAAEAALAEGDPELQAKVASLCNIGNTLDYVDLHNMSTLEARAAVLCVLSMLMTEYHDTGVPPNALTIVTGKGVNSENGQAVLPGTILRLLTEELYIQVTVDEENSGRIIIDAEMMLRWLRARVATRQQHQRNRRKAANAVNDD